MKINIELERKAEEVKNMSIFQLPLNLIDPSPLPVRDIEGQTINDLRESIKTFGVLQPILVRPKNGRYEIVFGNHRFYAAKGAGLTDIPAQVKPLKDSEALLLAVIENVQRLEMNPIKEGEVYNKLLDTSFFSVKDLANSLGKSVPYLKGRLSLYKNLCPDLKAKVGKKLTISAAIQISKLPRNQQKPLFDEIERTKENIEQKYKPHSLAYGGGGGPWSKFCRCPKCGSTHEKGVNYAENGGNGT